IETLKNNMNMFDEYIVENFHSLLRRHITSKVSSSREIMERKKTKKPYYYFDPIPTSFPLGALPLRYPSPVLPNMKKFCDKKFCKNSTNEEGEVLICGHAYHEECFRMHLEETQLELNDEEIDEDNCEVEESDNYKLKIEADSELQKRIIGCKLHHSMQKLEEEYNTQNRRVLTRQPDSTIGVIVGPSMGHYSEATKELTATSKFTIKLLGEDNIINNLRIIAAETTLHKRGFKYIYQIKREITSH
ncbi:2456_t:CDS:2, partial [Funneliformis geosporum]